MRKPPAWLGESWLALVPIAVSLAFSAAFIARSAFRVGDRVHFSLFDDAMISMRYARNLADGAGLVWNPGAPPVEGYSNLLWTLWMSVIHLAAVPDAMSSLVVMLTGAGLLVLNLLLVRAIADRLVGPAPPVATLAMLMTALFFALVFWTLRGMEVGLMATAVLASVLLALRIIESFARRDLYLLAVVLGAGLLIRDDFVVPAAVVAAYTILSVAKPDRRLVGAVLVAAPLVVIAGHTTFRLLYYGELLPNTYQLKLGGIGLDTRLPVGANMLLQLSVTSLYAALALAGVALVSARRGRIRGAYLLGAVFAGEAAYAAYVGGDAWEWMGFADRYLAAVCPLLFVLAAAGVKSLLTAPPATCARVATALAVVFSALFGVTQVPFTAERFPPATGWIQVLGGYAVLAIWFAGLAFVSSRFRARAGSLAAWPGGPIVAVITAVLLIGSLSASDLDAWRRDNGPHIADDANMTKYALQIKSATLPSASIAVVWAGAISYFSQRPAVDLLGRSDEVIARRSSRPIPFYPGHTKWDYEYSIGRLKPDLIAQLWRERPADLELIARFGYSGWEFRRSNPVVGRVFVRDDSGRVDRSMLRPWSRAGPLGPSTSN
jgi:hypothetical protein